MYMKSNRLCYLIFHTNYNNIKQYLYSVESILFGFFSNINETSPRVIILVVPINIYIKHAR